MTTVLGDIETYIGFDHAERAILRSLQPVLAPHFDAIADRFYARALAHPSARAVITGGAEQVAKLRGTLVGWMESGLLGPHDEAFYERRARIGRAHVSIGLAPQYMVAGMNVLRIEYREVLERAFADDLRRFAAASAAVDRLLDLELAIMLHTYRLDSEDRLRRRERLATIGQIAATIGHDLRNPLGVIESSLFLLRRRVGEDQASLRHVEKISAQLVMCARIVNDLLDLARDKPLALASVDVRAAFADALGSVELPPGVQVAQEVVEGLSLHADSGLLQRALVNLITNAAIALEPQGGTLALSATATTAGVEISVSDDGPGFDPAMLTRVFEPFVTNRAKGTGLGLALVKGIVERHGGRVIAENLASGGARVTLLLPRRTE